MNKKTLYTVLVSAMLSMGLSSCSDWLDVRGENIEKEQDMYSSYKGFTNALTGAYMDMASTDIYGKAMTMTVVEDLANLWRDNSNANYPEVRYETIHHKYDGDYSKDAMKSIYAKLFNVITSANIIIKNVKENGSNIPTADQRNIIEGEAYAMRAYCQLDVLRLFGQMPKNASKKVRLPYSEVTSIEDMPAYYDYEGYVAKLKADMDKAESLLKNSDPIFKETLGNINYPSSNVFEDATWYFRQSRLNYWAVRALRARMLMYIGETAEAAKVANEVINAKDSEGKTLISLSGKEDFKNAYYGLPSECLFYLSKYDVNTYTKNFLGSYNTARVASGTAAYCISKNMLTDLYASIASSTVSHNRYNNVWNRTVKDNSSKDCATINKYSYNEDVVSKNSQYWTININLMSKVQVIPMIRLSEMYLIAMEGATDIATANALYDTYELSCEYPLHATFDNMNDLKEEIVNEYRREFYAEGQMFYVYKRLGMKKMLWNTDGDMTENQYIIPLPTTEYESK